MERKMRMLQCQAISNTSLIVNYLDRRKRRSSFAVCVQNIWLNTGLTIDRKSETLIQVFLTKSSMW